MFEIEITLSPIGLLPSLPLPHTHIFFFSMYVPKVQSIPLKYPHTFLNHHYLHVSKGMNFFP